jgi:RNA polymerase sigma factor FliA
MKKEIGEVLDYEDMVSFGREGLLESARRFDPERGVSFRRYAAYRVRGAILDGVRSHAALSRRAYEKVRALQAALDVSAGWSEDTSASVAAGLAPEGADQRLSECLATLATTMAIGLGPIRAFDDDGAPIAVDPSQPPDEQAERAELMRVVRAELARLPEAEATLIRRHYLNDENIDQVAREMGLSKSWGSRILARGMSLLTKRLQGSSR